MFSRTTPGNRAAPEHDPLHLRIATAVMVLGLIAGGVAVVWQDMASRNGLLQTGAAGPGAAPSRALLKLPSATLTPAQTGNAGLRLQIAMSYGGRWDITGAVRQLAAKCATGALRPVDITEQQVAQALALADLPDPDLFVRTGGEHRISNFLLWNLAYTELYFTDCLWPDFDAGELDAALAFFGARERRFGRTPEQTRSPTSA